MGSYNNVHDIMPDNANSTLHLIDCSQKKINTTTINLDQYPVG